MGFIAAKCPNCGASVNLDESREFGFCTYCGTKIVQDKIVVEHRGNVTVDGISTLYTTLERAYIYHAQGDFENAEVYYNKALDISPKCARAYWGLLLCKVKAKDYEQFVQHCIYTQPDGILDKTPEYNNALQFANPNERQEFLSVTQQIERGRAARRQEQMLYEKNRLKSERIIAGIILGVLFLFTLIFILSAFYLRY